jgi:hypothetical protein
VPRLFPLPCCLGDPSGEDRADDSGTDIQPDAHSSVPLRFDWLCTRCSSPFDSNAVLNPHANVGFQTRQYHHNIEELKASVKLGGHLCTVLLASVKEKRIRELENALSSGLTD